MSTAPSDAEATHWCYHCNKRVVVETLDDDFVACSECNKGFVESIHPIPAAPPLSPDLSVEDSSIGSHFLQMLRLLAHAPSPPRLDVLSYEDEFFGLELNSRNEIEDEDEDDDEEEEEEEEDREEIIPVTTRSITGRNRILDWAEILMGIEDNSDRYTGNAADYVDEGAGYEALLQNLAEGDGGGGRRGAPPAAKSAVESLETFKVGSDDKMMVVVCAVCKDAMVIGETVKKLPCGHCYHGNCILPWLGTRNSCPVCRFQLKTDDAEYEEERKKRTINTSTSLTDSSAASTST